MKKFLCLAITMLFAVSAAIAGTRVYSNCYDGYLNVRSAPSSKSTIVGTLRNGPEGAELLGVEGGWSKVRINGVVGYVFSNYLQSKPTDPVYINASAVVGSWKGGGCTMTIKSDGKFVQDHYNENEGHFKLYGTWYLSYDKLIIKFSDDGNTTTFSVSGKTLSGEYGKFYRN